MSDENENNLTQDWPYRVPELSHEERIIELTKYIFEPLENFDFFTETHLAKHLMVGTEVHWNEGDDVSRPYSFDLMHFERAIIELDALLKSYPSPEEVITGLEDISLIKGDLLQHLELINNINENLIPSLNDHLLELQENIKDHSEELFILETVQAVAPPVPKNYIYTQYQDQKLPTKLWPASRWAEVGVSADYTLWRCQAMADNHTLMLIIFARKLYGLELRFEAMFPDFVMPTPEQEPEQKPEEGEDIEEGDLENELENDQMQRARVNELEGEEGELEGEGENTEPEDGQDIEEGELEGEPEEREEELRFIDLNARIVALNELLDDELLRKEQEEPEEEDGEGEEDGETEEGELELEQLLALYAPLNADEEEGELEPEEGEGETEEGEQGTTSNLAKLFAWCAHLEQRIMHALPEQEEPEEEDGEGEPESPQEPEEEGENPKEEGEEDLDNQ